MAKDFSWNGPAREYANLYEAARVSRGFAPTVQKVEKLEKAGKAEAAGREKIAGAEKETKSEAPVRRATKKAVQVAGPTSPVAAEAPQGPAKLNQGKVLSSQEAAQGTRDLGKDSQSLGPEAPEESEQALRDLEENNRPAEQAPQGSGKAGRNQKPATTSN
jgi:hypothetical protein